MSKQTFVISPKNDPRPLDVLGEHAAVLASGAGEMIHRLKEDVRSWYELHRRNGATNVVVWAIYLELLLMLVLLVLLPFDTVQVGGRYRLIKPLNFTMSMAMYLATVRAIPAVRYKRYQIHGVRHRGDTEKTYESYGRVT
jgi:hypothetical protein